LFKTETVKVTVGYAVA